MRRVIPKTPLVDNDNRKWCSLCHKRWSDVQKCTRINCGNTMCRRCFRLNGYRFQDRLKAGVSEETWEMCVKNHYWLCLGCCPPRVPAGPSESDIGDRASKARKREASATGGPGSTTPKDGTQFGPGGWVLLCACVCMCARVLGRRRMHTNLKEQVL